MLVSACCSGRKHQLNVWGFPSLVEQLEVTAGLSGTSMQLGHEELLLNGAAASVWSHLGQLEAGGEGGYVRVHATPCSPQAAVTAPAQTLLGDQGTRAALHWDMGIDSWYWGSHPCAAEQEQTPC